MMIVLAGVQLERGMIDSTCNVLVEPKMHMLAFKIGLSNNGDS